MAVEQDRDSLRVGDDAGHVRAGRDAADAEPPRRVTLELVLEVTEIEAPGGVGRG